MLRINDSSVQIWMHAVARQPHPKSSRLIIGPRIAEVVMRRALLVAVEYPFGGRRRKNWTLLTAMRLPQYVGVDCPVERRRRDLDESSRRSLWAWGLFDVCMG